MTAKARVEYDVLRDGVRIFVRANNLALSFPPTDQVLVSDDTESSTQVEPLRLREDEARAVYEALAAYYGGLGADMTALRRDYDAERKRVDKFIDWQLRRIP